MVNVHFVLPTALRADAFSPGKLWSVKRRMTAGSRPQKEHAQDRMLVSVARHEIQKPDHARLIVLCKPATAIDRDVSERHTAITRHLVSSMGPLRQHWLENLYHLYTTRLANL